MQYVEKSIIIVEKIKQNSGRDFMLQLRELTFKECYHETKIDVSTGET